MLLFRNVEQSVHEALKALFTNPPAGTLTVPWHVYGEDEFRQEGFEPEFPYLYLLQKRAMPSASQLPLAIVERDPTVRAVYEVGNTRGHLFTFLVHVFGRDHGEKADLAALVEEHLDRVALCDYGVTPPTPIETVVIINRTSMDLEVPENIGVEGTLSHGETVMFDFQTKE